MELNELRNVADIRSDLVQDGVLMYDEGSEVLTRLEQAEQDRDKLRNRLDAMRRQRDGYRNQLRRAEQQTARVRELREGQLCGHCADEVQDALDGGQDV